MGGQKGGAVLTIPNEDNKYKLINPLQIFTGNFKEFGIWVSKQSIPVQTTVITTYNAIQGAAYGGIFGAVAQVVANVFPQHSFAIKTRFPSPMAEARTWAALQGAHAGIFCIMNRIRGKDDAQTRMAAAFGAGFTGVLMKRMGHPNVARDPVLIGFVVALAGRVIFQPDQKTSPPPVEYTKTRCMLSDLGLQNYEKNFQKGLLTDTKMPFLTESVLKDVGVPPGPRIRILHHVERDPELQKMRDGVLDETVGSH